MHAREQRRAGDPRIADIPARGQPGSPFHPRISPIRYSWRVRMPLLHSALRRALLPALRPALLAPFLVCIGACSNSSNGAAPPNGTDAGAGDASSAADAGDPYENAVKAASWKLLPNAPKLTGGEKQDDIWFTSAMRGFAVSGPSSKIWATTDGGDTWTSAYSHPGTYFRSISFIDDNHGFASNLGPISGSPITDTNLLYETKDGGGSWNAVTKITGVPDGDGGTTLPTGICNQFQLDATHLVAVGRVSGPSYMMQSSDAGASWTTTDLNAKLAMLIDTRWTSPTDGIVVGGSAGAVMNCTILHTADAGKTWSTVFTSKTVNSLCWKITFPSAQVGYVSVQDAGAGPGTFAKTTDGGATWTEMPLPTTKAYPGIGMGFITENIGWVSADNPALPTYMTTDGGQTWNADAVLKSPINRFRFVDKNTAYAIGAAVYKLSVDFTGP
jgi:photosystem II stability/assembly factor-like uncharacterized protein